MQTPLLCIIAVLVQLPRRQLIVKHTDFTDYAGQTASKKKRVFVLKLVQKISNAITSNTAQGDWMVLPTRYEEQAVDMKAREESHLIIKSPGS